MSVRTVLAGVVITLTGVSCTPPPEPIQIQGGMLTVTNRTDSDWRDVQIWLNDHYRVTAPVVAAGSRFHAPLSGFVAGFGQRFDPARQSASGIELTAKAPDGSPVKLVWGRGRRQ